MLGSYQLLIGKFLLFTMILTRVGGLVVTAPVFGSAEVPRNIRALLAVALALLITPLHFSTPMADPGTTLNYLVLIGAEAMVGLIVGLGVQILFSGAQVAGQIISQMSGMQIAEVVNPTFDSGVPIFSQLLFYLTLAVFVILGGHRMVIEGLLDTFVLMPPGTATFSSSVTETLVDLLTQSFVLGIRAAAPTMVALLLTTLVLGLVSRTLPQLNVMSMGFGLSSLVTLGALCVSLGAVAWIFQEQVHTGVDALVDCLVRPSAATLPAGAR